MAENVRSLSKAKWRTIRAQMIALSVFACAMVERWNEYEDVDLELDDYIVIKSKEMGVVKGMVVLARCGRGRTKTSRHGVVLDRRHAMVVLLDTKIGVVGLVVVHMLLRTDAAGYNEVIQDIVQVHNQHPSVRYMAVGDWNRHAPTHDPTVAIAKWMRCVMLRQGDKGVLHKDWLTVPKENVVSARV